LLTKID